MTEEAIKRIAKDHSCNICDQCGNYCNYPECLPDFEEVLYGCGKGNDNIIACKNFSGDESIFAPPPDLENDYCVMPYQERLEGSHPKLCNLKYGKPKSGKCPDCIVFQHILTHLVSQPPPDSSRILTEEEIQYIITGGIVKYSALGVPFQRQAIDRDIAKAQLAKCDAECEARVKQERERVLREIGKWLACHYSARGLYAINLYDQDELVLGRWPESLKAGKEAGE